LFSGIIFDRLKTYLSQPLNHLITFPMDFTRHKKSFRIIMIVAMAVMIFSMLAFTLAPMF